MDLNFIGILHRSGPLSVVEKQALGDAVGKAVEVEAGKDVISEGELPSYSPILLSGFACRYKLFPEGDRQIMALQVPGDFCDLHSLFISSDHHVKALAPSTFALISRQELLDLIAEHPGVGHALWRSTLRDAAIFREWMAWIGRMDAYSRLTHLFCELAVRTRDAGVSDGKTFSMPLTQMDLADALGLSCVHVNRVLQRLRREKLVVLEHRSVAVLDWEGLAEVAQFDSTYLRFHGGEAGDLERRERKVQNGVSQSLQKPRQPQPAG